MLNSTAVAGYLYNLLAGYSFIILINFVSRCVTIIIITCESTTEKMFKMIFSQALVIRNTYLPLLKNELKLFIKKKQ